MKAALAYIQGQEEHGRIGGVTQKRAGSGRSAGVRGHSHSKSGAEALPMGTNGLRTSGERPPDRCRGRAERWLRRRAGSWAGL